MHNLFVARIAHVHGAGAARTAGRCAAGLTCAHGSRTTRGALQDRAARSRLETVLRTGSAGAASALDDSPIGAARLPGAICCAPGSGSRARAVTASVPRRRFRFRSQGCLRRLLGLLREPSAAATPAAGASGGRSARNSHLARVRPERFRRERSQAVLGHGGILGHEPHFVEANSVGAGERAFELLGER